MKASAAREGTSPLRHLERLWFWVTLGARELFEAVARSSPPRLALLVFILTVAIFASLLALPAAAANGRSTPLPDVVFTTISAVTVTGLTTVNTADHWSFFGQLLIIMGVQVGGLGIVTLASMLAGSIAPQFGLRAGLLAQQSISTGRLGEIGPLVQTVVKTSLILELVIALLLIPRFVALGASWPESVWHGLFYAVSSFNNAGFVAHAGGLAEFADDSWTLLTIMLGVFVGSLGFPVYMVLRAAGIDVRRWNLHTKLTVTVSLILFALGTAAWAIFEWTNSETIAELGTTDKILHAVFASVMMRSGGFNIIDTAASNPATLLISDALMFAGGGSASTGGGIKVTTLAILFLAIVAEARGDRHVNAFRRAIPEGALRIAISVTFLSATLIFTATTAILASGRYEFDRVLFEVISAFATCGLSVGLSAELDPFGKYVLAALMLAGRIGPVSLAAALTLKHKVQFYQYPQERPIIG